MKEYTVAEARDRLTRLIQEAEKGRPVRITRRGKPVAVLVSENQYAAMSTGHPGVWQAIAAWRARYGGIDLTDAEIAAWRDRSPPRDQMW